MKKIFFFIIIFSSVTSIQGADKKKPRNRTPSIPIPGKETPNSSSPSPASFSIDLFKSPKSWDTENNSGNITEDLNEMTSSTEFEKAQLKLPSPLTSPRGDNDEGPTQKKSCCAKFSRYFCCWHRKKKASSEYAAIS
jgi:hypothetical protein